MPNELIPVSSSGFDNGYQESSVTAVFDALSDPRRRYLLSYLREYGTESPETITRALTDWESDGTGITPTASDYGQVRNELMRVHLPTLAAVGLIEYTVDQELLTLTARSLVVFDNDEIADHGR